MKFKALHGVTWTVPDVASSAAAFRDCFGYTVVSTTPLTSEQAHRLDAPSAAGSVCVVLQPANGVEAFVRFVQTPLDPGYAPLKTYGWNAVEFLVQDVYGLAEQLADSPYEIIGPPRDLLDNDAVIAMQVRGPGQELLYLTEMRHEGLRKTFGAAEVPVDRFFIAILGVSDQDRTIELYRPFARRINIRRQFRITSIARAHGLDPDTARFDIASVVMSGPYRVETDAYPDTATPRRVIAGQLPPGLAVVSIRVEDMDESLAWVTGHSLDASAGRSFLLKGPDGERTELLALGESSGQSPKYW